MDVWVYICMDVWVYICMDAWAHAHMQHIQADTMTLYASFKNSEQVLSRVACVLSYCPFVCESICILPTCLFTSNVVYMWVPWIQVLCGQPTCMSKPYVCHFTRFFTPKIDSLPYSNFLHTHICMHHVALLLRLCSSNSCL